MTCHLLSSMATVKISSKVEEQVWKDLKLLAKESHQNVSGLLTEAISDYVHRRRVRPEVLNHLTDSIDENDELGHLLAK
jgi:predicted transcriptional regulator